mmetsp:Transcript_4553/g.6233  ORF Transcript_4553/g.6233 Transcript_4553/m.6233 type:complete len:276 (-) Transcript_4553:148-975(-)
MSLTFTKSSSVAQKVSGSLALIFSIISLGVIATWFQLHDVGALTDDPALHQGGLNWRNNIFNWHPILMTAGFILSFVWALLSFRLFPFDQKVNKFIHSFFHCASVVCWSLGLFAVVQRDNHNEYQYYGFYLIDLWSPHSWIGVTTMAWYGGVFLFGLLGFGFGLIPLELRPKYIGLHVSFGIITLVLVVASMESGIAELMGLDSICWPDYTVTSADTNPAANYSKHSFGCRLGNGAAILVLLTVMFTMHALIDVPTLQTTPLIAVKLQRFCHDFT